MFDILFAYLGRAKPLTAEDQTVIRSVFIPRELHKGEFLLREGEASKYGAFVTRGFLRSYIVDDKGKEHIIQFAPENWWISAKITSFDATASTFFIDAIEDSQVLLIDREGHQAMIEKVQAYAISFHEGIQKSAIAKDKRIAHALSSTAEERYNDFLKTYPSIAQRVPQHMLASYLGITPETLSRIRRRSMTKK